MAERWRRRYTTELDNLINDADEGGEPLKSPTLHFSEYAIHTDPANTMAPLGQTKLESISESVGTNEIAEQNSGGDVQIKVTDEENKQLYEQPSQQLKGLGREQKMKHQASVAKQEYSKMVHEEVDFLRIWIQREKPELDTPETRDVSRRLAQACMLRDRWLFVLENGHFPSAIHNEQDISLDVARSKANHMFPPPSSHCFEMIDGVFRVWDSQDQKTAEPAGKEKYRVRPIQEFLRDLQSLMELIMMGPAKSFCYSRLQILEAKYRLHMLLNEENEMREVKSVPHRDFYNVRKVDTHVHHSACMTQKHLLRFIKSRLKHNGTLSVMKDEKGEEVSLQQLFQRLNLTAYDLSIDLLNMHGHRQTFHRFDRFNAKYNPIGEPTLRQVFLKVENHINGLFLAQVTNEVFADLLESKYQYAEYRLSIYGKNRHEWTTLSKWVCNHKLHCPNVRWMVQIPRLYSVYRQSKIVKNFGEMLDNIFQPLFEVTVNPQANMELDLFLRLVVGFDSVDDESVQEHSKYRDPPSPHLWDSAEDPPYILWCYYLYANLYVLNKLREAKGMNTFTFRPHSGEAGDIDHVASTFLLAHAINHGLTIKKAPVLQFLYYLKQVGISMSPLSNNLLFIEYDKNPFPSFFQRGLNVTLSTDDPLLIHYTKDPLIEEYAIAAQVYKLSAIDMCEIARNSILQCGFPEECKRHWLGKKFQKRGIAGNDIHQSNVPDIRLRFRDELLREEENWILGLPPPIFPLSFTQQYRVMMTKTPKGIQRRRAPSEKKSNKEKENEIKDDSSPLLKHPPGKLPRYMSERDLGQWEAGVLNYPKRKSNSNEETNGGKITPTQSEKAKKDSTQSPDPNVEDPTNKYRGNKQITTRTDNLSYMNLYPADNRANVNITNIPNTNINRVMEKAIEIDPVRKNDVHTHKQEPEPEPQKREKRRLLSYNRQGPRVSLNLDAGALVRNDYIVLGIGLLTGYAIGKLMNVNNNNNNSTTDLWSWWFNTKANTITKP